MRPRSARTVAGGWLAAGTVVGGLLVGGVWFASAHGVTPKLLADLARPASAQEAAPTPQPATAAISRRPTGTVTQISSDPASFTVQAPDGTQTTYRVLDRTVFMAGRDRPYHFDLLKVGDEVVVRGGGQGQAAGATTAPAGAGKGKARPARAAGTDDTTDGEPVARQVIVRPAGAVGARKAGRGAGAQQGGTNGIGQ
jgi:hypothetical protein